MALANVNPSFKLRIFFFPNIPVEVLFQGPVHRSTLKEGPADHSLLPVSDTLRAGQCPLAISLGTRHCHSSSRLCPPERREDSPTLSNPDEEFQTIRRFLFVFPPGKSHYRVEQDVWSTQRPRVSLRCQDRFVSTVPRLLAEEVRRLECRFV